MESRPALSRLSQAGKPTPHLLGERAVRKLGVGGRRGGGSRPPRLPPHSQAAPPGVAGFTQMFSPPGTKQQALASLAQHSGLL